jgi:dienelactone hydrolase
MAHRPTARFRPNPALALAFATMGLASCASVTHMETAASPDPAIRPATDAVFAYPVEAVPVEDRLVASKGRYDLHRISFPSVAENGQRENLVMVDYHRSRVPGSHPVVIVLPIWGRHVYPSNAVTRTLRKRSDGNMHVLNVLGEDFLIDWPKLGTLTDEDEFIETWTRGAEHEIATVIDMRRLIDWAEDRPEIDAYRIGLIGFSHGAMLAPVLAAQEPRISATVLVMGGADPHEVIARCVGARTEGVQEHAERTFGWSRDEMATILDPIYNPINAASSPGRVDPARVLIFDAGRDECVPESARDSLWEAMGRPERFTIDADHRHAFYAMTPLRFNWMRKKIWSFFETRLIEGPAHSRTGEN